MSPSFPRTLSRAALAYLGLGVPGVVTPAAVQAQVADHLVYVLNGAAPGDRLGSALCTCGDVDRDGCADFIVGEPRADANGHDSGRVRVHSGADGRVLHTIAGEAADDQFGFAVSGAGDVDRDGHADFIVGAPGADAGGTNAGRARVYSGSDGHVLWTFDGSLASHLLGTSVAGIGDVNGDGHPDCIVGAPKAANNGALSGSAYVRSGRDGTVLWTWHGAAGGELGTWVGAAGDVDHDLVPDVIVGAPRTNGGTGRATVFSGRDGRTLWTFDGSTAGAEFGICASGAGDVDRDGHDDLVVGAWLDDRPQIDSGSVSVFSGRTGLVLAVYAGGAIDHLGWRVAGVGDVDGDGYPDVMAGKGYYFTPADQGYTRVWSGRDGSALRTFYGYQVGGGEDLTGDGVPDLVSGAWQVNGEAGTVWVHSGAPLTLAATPHALARTTGGSQTLRLQAGVAHAGRGYWLLGSVSGTRPGFRLLGFDFPLNLDPYTQFTLAPLGPPYFSGFQGTLDTAGRATAVLSLPSGLPPVSFHHAFVVYDGSGLHMVSNAASLRVD